MSNRGQGDPPGGEHYTVGYGRPPRASQFKPGQSGNPAGRPKNQWTLKDLAGEVLAQEVKIQTADGPSSMALARAILETLARKGLKGDLPSAKFLLSMLPDGQGLGERPMSPEETEAWEEAEFNRMAAELTNEEKALIPEILAMLASFLDPANRPEDEESDEG
ncbi:DUF5681 domain-containing protein [Phenylobacterium sp.]|jgi:hypothetical protein|uniref:DUF5681 domain-containing protein n=1 Tax=Phenylobacterium sp. TaxID=1871053 RepID=UPI0037CA83DB